MTAPPTMRHVYYSPGSTNMEQSLDVYTPAAPAANVELPLVVLIVGSAWAGHHAMIHAQTRWWNASGPKTVASLGAVCVCVRHRGTFPLPPPAWLVLALTLTAYAACGRRVAALVLALQVAHRLIARGSASFDMMMDDVCTALHWVRDHRAELCAPGAPPARRLVFGGYSSGAHVAASLLQRPDLLAARGLPPPEKLCDGVLYISGVLAVRPSADPAGPPALKSPRPPPHPCRPAGA